jgi:hypothetical protein
MIILEHYVSRGRHCVPEAMHLMACVALGLLLYGHIMSVVCNVCILHAEAAFAGRPVAAALLWWVLGPCCGLIGGVCVLDDGVTLPRNLGQLLEGVARFGVGTPGGAAVSTAVFGCAAAAAAAQTPPFPTHESDGPGFARAMTDRLRAEVSFDKVVFAPSLFFPRPRVPAIPKILHFIHLGSGDLHDYSARAVLTWLQMHPAWTVRVWSDGDLRDMLLAPTIAQARTFAQKADIMRTEILYHYGGLYVDSDFEAFRPIDPWSVRPSTQPNGPVLFTTYAQFYCA